MKFYIKLLETFGKTILTINKSFDILVIEFNQKKAILITNESPTICHKREYSQSNFKIQLLLYSI